MMRSSGIQGVFYICMGATAAPDRDLATASASWKRRQLLV
jgi:hypothetical protein